MTQDSTRRRLGRLEADLVPPAISTFTDGELIAAFTNRTAGPEEVRGLFDIVKEPMAVCIMELARVERIDRRNGVDSGRCPAGPIEIAVDVISHRLSETPSKAVPFGSYAPERWAKEPKNHQGIYYALWVHGHLLELLLDGDAQARDHRARQDRWQSDGVKPEELAPERMERLLDRRIGPVTKPIWDALPMMMDYPIVHPAIIEWYALMKHALDDDLQGEAESNGEAPDGNPGGAAPG